MENEIRRAGEGAQRQWYAERAGTGRTTDKLKYGRLRASRLYVPEQHKDEHDDEDDAERAHPSMAVAIAIAAAEASTAAEQK
jgi:hypothetical protein